MTNNYVIRGGSEGRARLSILSHALGRTTDDLLRWAGAREGISCLDVGCGGGDVTREMARLAGPEGRAVGIDIDTAKIELARRDAETEGVGNIEFLVSDVDDLNAHGEFDLVYARFLLTHLSDPGGILRHMVDAAAPGGAIVVEDIDHSAIFSYPESPAITRYVELYNSVVRGRGGDPEIGPRLPELFREAGLSDVRINVVQPVFMESEPKRMHAITLVNIADAVVAAGLASREEIDATAAEIEEFCRDPHTIVALPRVFQVWAFKEGGAA